MTNLQHTLSRAGRRARLRAFLVALPRHLLVSLGLAAVLAAADRGLGIPLPAEVIAGIGAAGLFSALARALGQRHAPLRLAHRLDDSLHLADRLATAVALGDRGIRERFDPGFVAIIEHQADDWAERVNVRSSFPLPGLDTRWAIAGGLALLIAGALTLLPPP